MPILPLPAPLSTFRIGLRAVILASESCTASVAISTARLASTSRPFSSQPSFRYSTWGTACSSIVTIRSLSPRIVPRAHARTLFTFRPITRYIDLPDSYTDAEGLPFRKEDLTQKEANKIFTTNLPAPQANILLRILHGRRVAGTLDDPSLTRNTRQFRIIDQKRALAYLREHVPVDEVLNAGLRAEDELEVIEERNNAPSSADGQEGGKDSKAPRPIPEEEEIPTGRLPKKPGSDSVYGIGNFDRIRAENIAKRKAEEARLEEERKLLEQEMADGKAGPLQKEQAKPREMSEFRKRHMARATSDLEAPPDMTAGQRLFPAMGMALAVVLGSVAFAVSYQAPPVSQRLFPEIPSAAVTCLSLIAVNIVVWGLWKFPPAWALLNKYMVLVVATPRPLQIVGAMWSHQSFSHLLTNMVFAWFFGTRLHDEIGRANFLALYFSSGAVGFLSSLAYLVLSGNIYSTTLGASGAVYGLIAAFFWMHKFDEFKILGFPPDPIWAPQGLAFLAMILALHVIPFFTKRGHGIDVTSHLGGMLMGIVGIGLARQNMEYKARVRAERLKIVSTPDTDAEEKDAIPTAGDASTSSPST